LLVAAAAAAAAAVSDYSAEWGSEAYARCVKRSAKTKAPLAACTTFQELVEEVMEFQSSTMAAATSVSASEILKRSFDNKFYRDYGDDIVNDVLDWMLKLRLRDEERIRKRLANQLGSWLLKVAAQDTNMQNVGRSDEQFNKVF